MKFIPSAFANHHPPQGEMVQEAPTPTTTALPSSIDPVLLGAIVLLGIAAFMWMLRRK